MSFTDIKRKNWIEKLPKFSQPYAYLMRLDRPIGWWLLLLPAWWGILLASPIITFQTIFMLFLFFAGAVIMRGAGCVINDIWDRDLDRQVERTASRPLASGEISLEDAVIFLILLLMCGLIVLIFMPFTTIILGIFSLPFIALYPLMKRFTWWPQAFLGITFNFGALMGVSAMTGTVTLPAVFLYMACFFWTLGYDTVYAHQDKQDDKKIGIKSTALLFGDKSPFFVFSFYGIAAFLLTIVMFISPVSMLNFIMIFIAFGYAGYCLADWNPEKQDSSLKMMNDNREVGLLIFLALAL